MGKKHGKIRRPMSNFPMYFLEMRFTGAGKTDGNGY